MSDTAGIEVMGKKILPVLRTEDTVILPVTSGFNFVG
jgi:hypothetical protein